MPKSKATASTSGSCHEQAPWTSEHTQWLHDTGQRLKTADDKEVQIWEFRYERDEAVLSAWAKHFRNHYCLDIEIDALRAKRTRKDYLTDIKFPCKTSNLGRAVRAGDFGEILVADFLEWLLGFWVPRVRWSTKVVRDESAKGSDVIGFRFEGKDGEASNLDVLAVFEGKTKFSTSGDNRLQDAANDSAKDHLRIDESLNFIKQKLLDKGEHEQANAVERFQSPVDLPYKQMFGAAAIISEEHYDEGILTSTNCREIPKSRRSGETIVHPNWDDLTLLVIKGPSMMKLVHELYERAANEA